MELELDYELHTFDAFEQTVLDVHRVVIQHFSYPTLNMCFSSCFVETFY